MSNVQVILYVAAVCVLLAGALIDLPRFNVLRCIALALALVLSAQTPILR